MLKYVYRRVCAESKILIGTSPGLLTLLYCIRNHAPCIDYMAILRTNEFVRKEKELRVIPVQKVHYNYRIK